MADRFIAAVTAAVDPSVSVAVTKFCSESANAADSAKESATVSVFVDDPATLVAAAPLTLSADTLIGSVVSTIPAVKIVDVASVLTRSSAIAATNPSCVLIEYVEGPPPLAPCKKN
jgi:hypothetical protein